MEMGNGILDAWRSSNEPPEPYQGRHIGVLTESIALMGHGKNRSRYESKIGKKILIAFTSVIV